MGYQYYYKLHRLYCSIECGYQYYYKLHRLYCSIECGYLYYYKLHRLDYSIECGYQYYCILFAASMRTCICICGRGVGVVGGVWE